MQLFWYLLLLETYYKINCVKLNSYQTTYYELFHEIRDQLKKYYFSVLNTCCMIPSQLTVCPLSLKLSTSLEKYRVVHSFYFLDKI